MSVTGSSEQFAPRLDLKLTLKNNVGRSIIKFTRSEDYERF